MITLTEEQAQQIEEALNAVKQMCEVAHPQFNWGASFLQADGIALLNEAPQAATKALATIRAARAQEQEQVKKEQRKCEYNSGTCERRGCVGVCQAIALCNLYNKLAEQAEQEPVAIIEKESGFETEVYATGHADDLPDGVFKLYAAPVRTKDLTVSELDAIIEKHYDDEMDLKAMILDGIAADRRKNNV